MADVRQVPGRLGTGGRGRAVTGIRPVRRRLRGSPGLLLQGNESDEDRDNQAKASPDDLLANAEEVARETEDEQDCQEGG